MNNTYKKVVLIFLVIFFISSGLFSASVISAETLINSVKLNGSDNLTVEGGGKIFAAVNVTLTNPSVWKSTAYRFGDGNWNCIDTQDYSGNITVIETFPIPGPAKMGTSNVEFSIYGNNDCTNGLNPKMMSANLLTSVTSVLFLGTGGIWLFVLVLIILAIIIFYIVKKSVNKKIDTNLWQKK